MLRVSYKKNSIHAKKMAITRALKNCQSENRLAYLRNLKKNLFQPTRILESGFLMHKIIKKLNFNLLESLLQKNYIKS
jgi:hypothetical protein